MKSIATAVVVLSLAVSASAQDDAPRAAPTKKDGPWFGVALPPKAGAAPAVKVGTRPPRPTTPDATAPEFAGASLKTDVETIVGFARAAGQRKEIGNGQMWGRISAFHRAARPSSGPSINSARRPSRK
jgi:hypothetical protein